jgi:EAL domain-containing protein (putative c-di-GMP-specific phosphodiesterase class I)
MSFSSKMVNLINIQQDKINSIPEDLLIDDLRAAVRQMLFTMVYQPKGCAQNRTTLGAEVLLRWNHPLCGLVPADKWVPLAETHNLMEPLTLWLANSVINSLKTANSLAIPLAINVPPNILNVSFANYIVNALKTAKVSAHLLEIEITETSPVDNMKILAKSVDILKNAGLKIYLDDLGTGYSTMQYLVDLPVSGVKIDKSFVQQGLTNGSAYLILKALIMLAREIGLEVVCEGVETEEQLAMVKEFGAQIIQGYLISRPLNAKDFNQWQSTSPFPFLPGANTPS